MSKYDSAAKKKRDDRNKAVALRYNLEEDMAPVVIASGYGAIADKIIDIAEEKGIPVFKDDSAASMLCMLEVGRNIPAELYEVIATIYTQILKVSSEVKHADVEPSITAPRASAIRERLATNRRSGGNS